MIAKLRTTASDNVPVLMLRKVIVAVPAPMLDTQQLYAPAVAAPDTFRISTSLADKTLFVNVKVTLVTVASDALLIVI